MTMTSIRDRVFLKSRFILLSTSVLKVIPLSYYQSLSEATPNKQNRFLLFSIYLLFFIWIILLFDAKKGMTFR